MAFFPANNKHYDYTLIHFAAQGNASGIVSVPITEQFRYIIISAFSGPDGNIGGEGDFTFSISSDAEIIEQLPLNGNSKFGGCYIIKNTPQTVIQYRVGSRYAIGAFAIIGIK